MKAETESGRSDLGGCIEKLRAVLAQTSPELLCFYVFVLYILPPSNMGFEQFISPHSSNYSNNVVKSTNLEGSEHRLRVIRSASLNLSSLPFLHL